MSNEYTPNRGTSTYVDTRATGGAIARRALIAAAGLAVVGVGAVEAPKILDAIAQLPEEELQRAIAQGRKDLARELLELEEVPVETALEVVSILHTAVNLVVIPIATLLVQLLEMGLNVAIGVAQKALQVANWAGIQITALNVMIQMFQGWQVNAQFLPSTLQLINNTDTSQSQTYLNALIAKLNTEIQQDS